MSRRVRIDLRFLVCGFIASGAIFVGSNARPSLVLDYYGQRAIQRRKQLVSIRNSRPGRLCQLRGWLYPYTVNVSWQIISAILLPITRHKFLAHRDNGVTFDGSTAAGRGASTYSVTSTTQTEANRAIIIGEGTGDNSSAYVSPHRHRVLRPVVFTQHGAATSAM